MWYKDHDYKVGEVVRFRQWDDMKSEFGLNVHGCIRITGKPQFRTDMIHLCGTKARIKHFWANFSGWPEVIGDVELDCFESDGDTDWSYALEMLEPVEEPCSFDEGGFLSMLG